MTGRTCNCQQAATVDIELLTVKDLQQIFKCSQKFARELMHTKGFPTITIGRKMFVEKNKLLKYLERNEGKIVRKINF